MGKLDLAAAPPTPLAQPHMRGAAKPRVNTQALVPERSGVGNLRHRAPEEDGGEIGDPTDMAQRLQDQAGGLIDFLAPTATVPELEASQKAAMLDALKAGRQQGYEPSLQFFRNQRAHAWPGRADPRQGGRARALPRAERERQQDPQPSAAAPPVSGRGARRQLGAAPDRGAGSMARYSRAHHGHRRDEAPRRLG